MIVSLSIVMHVWLTVRVFFLSGFGTLSLGFHH